jgi:hypothetical protein
MGVAMAAFDCEDVTLRAEAVRRAILSDGPNAAPSTSP